MPLPVRLCRRPDSEYSTVSMSRRPNGVVCCLDLSREIPAALGDNPVGVARSFLLTPSSFSLRCREPKDPTTPELLAGRAQQVAGWKVGRVGSSLPARADMMVPFAAQPHDAPVVASIALAAVTPATDQNIELGKIDMAAVKARQIAAGRGLACDCRRAPEQDVGE